MADDDRWAGGASSWNRGYQTSAVNQGSAGGSSDNQGSDRTRVMDDDFDDDWPGRGQGNGWSSE